MSVTLKPTKALFLYEAAWQFAPRAMREAAVQDRSKPRPKVRVKRFDNVSEKVAEGFDRFHEIMGQAIHDLSNPEEPTREMKVSLIAGLLSEKFQAFGIMIKPKVGSKPQKLPTFVFENKPNIDWFNNAIENVAHRFEGVKIHRNFLNKTRIEPRSQKLVRGRPSVEPDIFDAVKAAVKSDKSFLTLNRKNQCQEIRKRLNSIAGTRYDANYPADRTIKKAIHGGLGRLKTSN